MSHSVSDSPAVGSPTYNRPEPGNSTSGGPASGGPKPHGPGCDHSPSANLAQPEERTVCIVVYDGCNAVDITGPAEVFSQATAAGLRVDSPALPYRITLASSGGAPVRTSSGIRMAADTDFLTMSESVDTLIVSGGEITDIIHHQPLLNWLRKLSATSRRTVSVCSGSFLLAAAGLLRGRRATTHWAATQVMQSLYPETTVDTDAIFVRDGNIYTSAGITAGMDLALALVEEDHGRELAMEVARQMVLFLRRPGGQAQFSVHLAGQSVNNSPIQKVCRWIQDHLANPMDVTDMAKQAGMSPRNFARVFASAMGTTPARYVERIRVEAARLRLESGRETLQAIATNCGFGSVERMRRAFRRQLRVLPSEYATRFSSSPSQLPKEYNP